MDSLEFAREIWREFNLNESKGAGMKITEGGIEIKSYGAPTEIRGKEMGESIVFHREKVEVEKHRKR